MSKWLRIFAYELLRWMQNGKINWGLYLKVRQDFKRIARLIVMAQHTLSPGFNPSTKEKEKKKK
jgi:hypothetical protein